MNKKTENKKPVEPMKPHKPYLPPPNRPSKTIKQFKQIGQIVMGTYVDMTLKEFESKLADIAKKADKDNTTVYFEAETDHYDHSVNRVVIRFNLQNEIPNLQYNAFLKEAELQKKENQKLTKKYNKEVEQYEEDYREYEIAMKKYLNNKFGDK
jgi:hypothetical protein